MLEFLRARLTQGIRTTTYPSGESELPERFRGRPAIDRKDGDPLIRDGGNGRAELDLGACLFSPEESIDTSGRRIRFTRDVAMATRTRGDLVMSADRYQLATAFEEDLRRLLGRSLRLRSVVAGSCGGCEAELVALSNVVFDLARFGVQFVASPRHADGIVVTGAVNRNMRGALRATWEAVPDPRIVIAVGACAASGGPFRGSPEIANGVADMDIPVDLWIPGCPPHPLTMLDGLLRLLGRMDVV